jgi:hypothetical protein
MQGNECDHRDSKLHVKCISALDPHPRAAGMSEQTVDQLHPENDKSVESSELR